MLHSYQPHTVVRSGRFFQIPDVFQTEGSVLPTVLPQVFSSTLWAFFIFISVVVGMLLVFRTNASYDRFYEGRRLWTDLKVQVRNLARYIWIFLPSSATTPTQSVHGETNDKVMGLKLLVCLPYLIRDLLRDELVSGKPLNVDTYQVLPNSLRLSFYKFYASYNTDVPDLIQTSDPELPFAELNEGLDADGTQLISAVLLRLNEIIQGHYIGVPGDKSNSGHIDPQCHSMMGAQLSALAVTQASLERISRTPVPLAYRIHLAQAQWLYLIVLPFTLVNNTGYFTLIVQAIVAFTFFGITAIGAEIENPFGRDANDLPLDAICNELSNEVWVMTKRL